MSFGFGARLRSSVQTNLWAPINTRSTLRVAQISTGTPIRSAYQRFGLSAALATEFETRPCTPSDLAAASGDSELASEANPRPATTTSASGSSQMKSR